MLAWLRHQQPSAPSTGLKDERIYLPAVSNKLLCRRPMSNMKSSVGVVSALLFFGRNCAHFFNAAEIHFRHTPLLHLRLIWVFFSLRFIHVRLRDNSRQSIFSNVGKIYRIECSTQIWLRCRFDFYSSVASFSFSFFILSVESRRITTDLIAMENIHNNNHFFSRFFFYIFQFIIQNKTTTKKCRYCLYSKTWNISLSYMFIKMSWAL